jgi:putative addiction module killer protein
MEVLRYITESGQDVVGEWLLALSDARARAKVNTRLARLLAGNFGNCRPLRGEVWELRINYGPGYRVYYAMAGREIVLLLCGGGKRSQRRDIASG